MRPKYLWRGASLIVLGTTASVLGVDYAYRHPNWVAAAPLAVVSRLVNYAAQQGTTEAAERKPVLSPAEETNEPISDGRKTEILQIWNAQAPDVAHLLETVLGTTHPDVTIVTEPVCNKLIITIAANKYDDVMEQVAKLIKAIDVRPAQVEIDVLIVEVPWQDGKGRLAIFGDNENVRCMAYEKFKELIADLQKTEQIEVIAAPQIFTTDNQAARILIGQSFPYVTGTAVTAATTDTAATTNTVAYRDVGLQVQVTPKIAPDGTVTMRIIPEISTASPMQASNGISATKFNVQTLETTLIIKDGQTAVLGGLTKMEDAETTRNCGRHSQKKDVLVFVTPHVTKQRQ